MSNLNFPIWRMAFAGFVAFLLSFSLTPAAKRLLMRFGIVDMPSSRRINKTPIPRGGGIAIVVSSAIAVLFGIFGLGIDDPVWCQSSPRILAAFATIIAVGIADDIRGLNPFAKLAGQIAAALLVYSSGISFGHLVLFSVPPWLDCIITIGWFVIIVNSFNLIDGMDGLATGLAVIGAIGLLTCLVLRHQGDRTLSLFVLIGASLGFLRYNFNPASIFLGDTGSLFLGFCLALLPLVTGGKTAFVASIGVPLLAIGLPLFDTVLAIVRRTARAMLGTENGIREVVLPDVEHLHHRLLAVGANQRRAAILLYMLAATLVLAAIILTVNSNSTGAIVIAILVVFAILGRQMTNIELWYVGRAANNAISSLKGRTLTVAYIVIDAAIMVVSWFISANLALVPHIGINGLHLSSAFAPFVIAIFAFFAAARIYRRRWDRLQTLDIVVLTMAAIAGWLLAYGYVSTVGRPYLAFDRHACVFLALILTPMMLARIVRVTLRQLISAIGTARNAAGTDSTRIAVIGSGIGFSLFYRLVNNGQGSFKKYSVVLVSDFKSQYIGNYSQGFHVLDAMHELPSALKSANVSEIIVASVSGYTPEQNSFIRELAARHGLKVRHFSLAIGDGTGDPGPQA